MTNEIINLFYLILPSYFANSLPVLAKGKIPLDGGNYLNKHRILGDGKTFEGTFLGVCGGICIGLLLIIAQNFGINVQYKMTLDLAIILPILSIFGDILGSFIKRRIGVNRGDPILFLDQLDFIILPLFVLWMKYKFSLVSIFVVLLITLIIHIVMNKIAYVLKLKDKPW
jgi:CDP-2,3-bis-(O-geranylgeranyl)-sn-glycerol synthase